MAKTQKKSIAQDNAEHSAQVALLKQERKGHSEQVTTKRKAKAVVIPDTVASASTPSSPRAPAHHSKQGILITLLQNPAGATIDELAEATGWQRHSVHGVMSGALKKRLGLSIASSKEARGRVYRVVGAQ